MANTDDSITEWQVKACPRTTIWQIPMIVLKKDGVLPVQMGPTSATRGVIKRCRFLVLSLLFPYNLYGDICNVFQT